MRSVVTPRVAWWEACLRIVLTFPHTLGDYGLFAPYSPTFSHILREEGGHFAQHSLTFSGREGGC